MLVFFLCIHRVMVWLYCTDTERNRKRTRAGPTLSVSSNSIGPGWMVNRPPGSSYSWPSLISISFWSGLPTHHNQSWLCKSIPPNSPFSPLHPPLPQPLHNLFHLTTSLQDRKYQMFWFHKMYYTTYNKHIFGFSVLPSCPRERFENKGCSSWKALLNIKQ